MALLIWYGWLCQVKHPKLINPFQSNDVRSSLEILKNSYLAIVNSLVILNERRRKRQQEKMISTSSDISQQESNVESNSSNFINSKVAHNFRHSDTDYLSIYPDTYEWNIDKFCDPETRETEFQKLINEVRATKYKTAKKYIFSSLQSESYVNYISKQKHNWDSMELSEFQTLVRRVSSSQN